MRSLTVLLSFAALVNFAALPATAQGAGVPPNERQAAFARSYIQATRQQEAGQFWALVHPASLECMEPAYKGYVVLDEFEAAMNSPAGEKYALEIIPVGPKDVSGYYRKELGEDVAIPVVPPFALAISYEEKRGVCPPKPVKRFVFIAPDPSGEWREVFACPKRTRLTEESYKLARGLEDVEYAMAETSLLPELRKQVDKLILRDKAISYAMQLLEKYGLTESLAERYVDEKCSGAAEDAQKKTRPR